MPEIDWPDGPEVAANWHDPPVVVQHEGIFVVREDLRYGGTKSRVAHLVLNGNEECVYPATQRGKAGIALAIACCDHDKRLTLFVPKMKELHEIWYEAQALGARVVEVVQGRTKVLKARARDYVAEDRSTRDLVPYGLDTPAVIEALAEIARRVPAQNGLEPPREVWTAAGTGALTRALQLAWPDADFHAVSVGASAPNVGRAKPYHAPEKWDKKAKYPPPFPSAREYDAKVWQFIKRYGREGCWFWNVAGD
jgi:hypothetical protein